MAKLNGSEQLPNVTNQTSPAEPAYWTCAGPLPSITVKLTTYSLFMLLSLIGNLLIVAVFFRNRSLRTTVHYFIVNIAIADLIIPVITLPWQIIDEYVGTWLVDGVLGTILCKVVFIAWDLSLLVSEFSMVAIAADRFHAVLFPMKSSLISRDTFPVIIAATWIASMAFWAHFIYAAKLVSNDSRLQCTLDWEPASRTWDMLKITFILHLCLTSLSAAVLTVLYLKLIMFLYRQKNNLHLACEIIQKRAKRNRKVTCMLVITVVVFYVVWIPFFVSSFYYYFKFNSIILPCFNNWMTTRIFPLLYPMVNPLVYYIFNEDYRKGFRELLCCPWICNKCNVCFHASVSPQEDNNNHSPGHVNHAIENIQLQEQ